MRFTRWLSLALLAASSGVHAQDTAPRVGDTPRSLIASEVRAFQRDLAAKDWNTLLTHFWPAKITARWEPPVDNASWAAASLGPSVASGSGARRTTPARADDEPVIVIVGRWARVLLRSDSASADELWMLEVNGRWKIVRLTLGDDRA